MQEITTGKTISIVVAFIALVRSILCIVTKCVTDGRVVVFNQKLLVSFEGFRNTTVFFV